MLLNWNSYWRDLIFTLISLYALTKNEKINKKQSYASVITISEPL